MPAKKAAPRTRKAATPVPPRKPRLIQPGRPGEKLVPTMRKFHKKGGAVPKIRKIDPYRKRNTTQKA